VKAPEHKPLKRVTQNGHCEEYCPAKRKEGRNNEHYANSFKNHDTKNKGNDFASERHIHSNAPQVVPIYAVGNNAVIQKEYKERVASESANSADAVPHQANFCMKKLLRSKFESDTEDESELEGERLFDNQEQSVPAVSIEVGRMTKDLSDEIISPVDAPTIHHRKPREPVITPGRTTIARKVPNKVGRTQADESPESLRGPTLKQQRQKLRDLRTAIKIRLDNYVHKEVGNLEVGRTRVAASTQPISTQDLAQARQTLRDLRTDIKVRLDDYVQRETKHLQSLQYCSGTENVKSPPTTLEQVQTSRYKTLVQPEASTRTRTTRQRRSQQQTNHMNIRAHFVFDRGKAATICKPTEETKQKQ
jgi:hypothetical protein